MNPDGTFSILSRNGNANKITKETTSSQVQQSLVLPISAQSSASLPLPQQSQHTQRFQISQVARQTVPALPESTEKPAPKRRSRVNKKISDIAQSIQTTTSHIPTAFDEGATPVSRPSLHDFWSPNFGSGSRFNHRNQETAIEQPKPQPAQALNHQQHQQHQQQQQPQHQQQQPTAFTNEALLMSAGATQPWIQPAWSLMEHTGASPNPAQANFETSHHHHQPHNDSSLLDVQLMNTWAEVFASQNIRQLEQTASNATNTPHMQHPQSLHHQNILNQPHFFPPPYSTPVHHHQQPSFPHHIEYQQLQQQQHYHHQQPFHTTVPFMAPPHESHDLVSGPVAQEYNPLVSPVDIEACLRSLVETEDVGKVGNLHYNLTSTATGSAPFEYNYNNYSPLPTGNDSSSLSSVLHTAATAADVPSVTVTTDVETTPAPAAKKRRKTTKKTKDAAAQEDARKESVTDADWDSLFQHANAAATSFANLMGTGATPAEIHSDFLQLMNPFPSGTPAFKKETSKSSKKRKACVNDQL
jgi:hypothetical protein